MTTTPEDLLAAWGTRYGLSGRSLLALHRAGRTLLIFDAFDEMANVSDRADRFSHFGALWRYACNGSRILFTGRPNFFLDDEELKSALGIAASTSVGPYCTAVHIEPFSEQQIADSLRRLPREKATTLIQLLNRLPRLREIAERPSLLLSQLWHHDRINLNDATLESATIIAKFVDYSLERQVAKQFTDVSSTLYDQNFIGLRQSELEYFTIGCAVAALREGRNNYLSEPVLNATIAKLWDAIGEQDAFDLKAAEGGALSMTITERFRDKHDPLEACLQAVRTHGVIEHDPTRSGAYKFSHKSFAEALAAEVISAGMLNSRGEAERVWRVEQPVELIQQDAVFQFCCDLISSGCGREASVAEHTTFANLTGVTDNLMNRLGYVLLREMARSNLALKRWSKGRKTRRLVLWLMGSGLLSGDDLFSGRDGRGGIRSRALSVFVGMAVGIYIIIFWFICWGVTFNLAPPKSVTKCSTRQCPWCSRWWVV